MAKKPIYKGEGNPIDVVGQHTRKNGKIRGKNKKHTRVLKGICCHHRRNSKNRLKATLNSQNGMCTCRMCGSTFKGRTYDKEESKELIAGFNELNGNAKFLAVATGAGNDAIRFFSEAGAMAAMYLKNYRKLAKMAEKQNQVKKKKKKKDSTDYSQLGGWSRK